MAVRKSLILVVIAMLILGYFYLTMWITGSNLEHIESSLKIVDLSMKESNIQNLYVLEQFLVDQKSTIENSFLMRHHPLAHEVLDSIQEKYDRVLNKRLGLQLLEGSQNEN
jgi:hypothetical protein